MEATDKLIAIRKFQDSKFYDIAYQSDTGKIIFDAVDADIIGTVEIDQYAMPDEFMEWPGTATHYDWRFCKNFLRDQFFAHLDSLEILAP